MGLRRFWRPQYLPQRLRDWGFLMPPNAPAARILIDQQAVMRWVVFGLEVQVNGPRLPVPVR